MSSGGPDPATLATLVPVSYRELYSQRQEVVGDALADDD
ncbi:hypothetical protein FM113_07690 [Leucobacter sp. 7(1)]|nr:hypothetical protein FM113_07690 [Leucobacter sp. 7(1)]